MSSSESKKRVIYTEVDVIQEGVKYNKLKFVNCNKNLFNTKEDEIIIFDTRGIDDDKNMTYYTIVR